MITIIIQKLKKIKEEITSITATKKDIFMSAIDGNNQTFQELRQKQTDIEANSSFISKSFMFFYYKLQKINFIKNIINKPPTTEIIIEAIENACKTDNMDIAKYLFAFFADNLNINTYKQLAHVPTCLAFRYGYVDFIVALAKAGANLNQADAKGWTLVHETAQYGHGIIIAELAKAGADLNTADTYGRAPMHIAAINGHAAVIEELTKAGADLNKEDAKGLTPLHIAVSNGHAGVVAELAVAKGVILNTDQLLMAFNWAVNYDNMLLSIHCWTEINKRLQLASPSTVLEVQEKLSNCETQCKKMHHAFMTNMSVCVKKNMPQEIFRNILSFISGSYENLPKTSMKAINTNITMVYNAIDKRSKDTAKVAALQKSTKIKAAS